MPWVEEWSHGHPCPISYSKLKVACESTWAQYKYQLDNPRPLGEAANFSKLFHSILFGQDSGPIYTEPSVNLRTGEGKEVFAQWASTIVRNATVVAVNHDPSWMLERLGRSDLTVIDSGDFTRAESMAKSVRSRAFWKEFFPKGVAEQKGEVELEGCLLRFVPDLRVPSHGLIVDVKGVRDVSEHGLTKAIFDYLWDVQASMYLKGASAIDGVRYDRYVIVFCLNEPPFLTVEREIPADVVQFAWDVVVQKLRELRTCVQFDQWPGHDETIKTIDWKPWMVAHRESLINVGSTR